MSIFLELLRAENSKKLSELLVSLNLDTEQEMQNFLKTNLNLKKIIESEKSFSNTEKYYEETYFKSNRILEVLESCDDYVDLDNLSSLEEMYSTSEDKRNLNIIRSFKPSTESIIYDRLKSMTGRIRIDSGPQILTLKKEDRKKIFSDPNIYSIDFRALEPSLLFQLLGFLDFDYSDIYNSIKNYLKLESIDRSYIKLSVLKILYGSSLTHINELNPTEVQNLNNFLYSKEIISFKDRLKTDLYQNGFLYNLFGKPLLSKKNAEKISFQDYMLLNYFIQSSAVDLALLLLSEFYESNKIDIIPLFVIHDALVFYAKPSFNTQDLNRKFQFKKFNFYAKISHISE